MGLSLMLSPEQTLLDMELAIATDDTATFLFYCHRISKETPVKLTHFLKSHEGDWRPGIGWMCEKFDGFFKRQISVCWIFLEPRPTRDTMASLMWKHSRA